MARKSWTSYCRKKHEKVFNPSVDAKTIIWGIVAIFVVMHILFLGLLLGT